MKVKFEFLELKPAIVTPANRSQPLLRRRLAKVEAGATAEVVTETPSSADGPRDVERLRARFGVPDSSRDDRLTA